MSKKRTMILLLILAIVGSFVCFYATNLIFSDVSNIFYGLHDAFLITSFPGFIVSWDLVMATLYVIRLYLRPQYKKALRKTYSIRLLCFSILGIASSVVSGLFFYKSFTAPYPFPYYLIICMILHAILLVIAVASLIKLKDLQADKEKRPFKMSYSLYSIFITLFVFYSYNRFGALLFMPSYVHLRSLYMTFPFYLSLLLPMALLFQTALFAFDAYKKNPKGNNILTLAILVLDVLLSSAIFITGTNNTQFISAISPALGIERLSSLPVGTIFLFAFVLIYGIYLFIRERKLMKKK